MFLNLWAQVWVLQLLKERRLANASGEPYPLAAAALAVAVANAWWALWRRRRLVGARALLAVAGLWYLAARGSSSNHIALQAVVCVAVLEASFAGDDAAVRRALRRGGCEVLGALYLVTALAKCNDGWVDPHASCATLYTVAGAAEFRPGLAWPREALALLPYGALAGEFGLALAFYLRARGSLTRYRKRLLALGALFHVGLAAPRPPLSVYPFSALMAPLFALAVLESDAPAATGAGALGAAAAAALAAEARSPATRLEYPPYCSWDLGLAWCGGAFALLAVAAAREPKAAPAARRRGAPLAALAVLCLGALPYLGLRTHPCFAMFSNLRVEGGASNHWLFTAERLAALDLGGGAMADGVVVTAADAAAVRHMRVDLGRWLAPAAADALARSGAASGFYIAPPAAAWPPPGWPPAPAAFEPFGTPWVELRRRVSAAVAADPGLALRVAYERRGERRVFERYADGALAPGSDPELLEPLRGLRALVFKFRAFDAGPGSPCRH